MDVHRPAAIDMWGTAGTIRRRRIIVAGFAAGFAGLVALGIWAFVPCTFVVWGFRRASR